MSTSLLERLHTAWLSLAEGSPLPWLVLTMLVYMAAMAIYRKSGNRPLLIPVFTGVVVIVAILMITGTPYATYRSGVSLLGLMIGPATVALAIPLYAQRERISQLWLPISVALLVGCLVALLSALGIAWATGISGTMMAPLLCRVLRLRDPAVEGFAIGLTAHAIGTARAIQLNPTAGAFSALAMGLNGVATAVLMPLVLAITPWI